MKETKSDEHDGAEQQAILEKHVRALSEHFDAVQIMASVYLADGKGTRSIEAGSGNIHTREGHARHWVLKLEEDARIEARKDRENEEEDEE